jgi:ribose 5-phosphate isomerase
MVILQIEHLVPDFTGWKKAFDSDPLNRKQSGVRSYRIFRATDNPNYIIIELEFDNLQEAEKMHENLKQLWPRVEGKIMMNPQSRIIETIESIEYDR